MKIAHVQVIPHLSGAQQVSLDIFSSLKGGEYELFMICGEIKDYSEDFVEKFKQIGVTLIEVPSLKRELGKHDLTAFKELYDVFKKYNFDIVHTNSTKPAILARIAARLAGCKQVIHTVHGVAFHKHIPIVRRFFFYFAELFSLYFGHQNITVNNYYKKYYPLANTKTIYNGVDFSAFKVEAEKCKLPNSINFAFFARLDDQKNPFEFIKAIHLLYLDGVLDNYKDVRFTLAGDGELMSECIELVKKLGLESQIEIKGWIRDKNTFLNTVDVICQPSKWEAFGLVFVEAAYFNIPAIATKVEGIPEVVLDGETGLLYSDGEVGLKNCILELIENRELIKKLGLNAKNRALCLFSKERMVANYHDVYFNRK